MTTKQSAASKKKPRATDQPLPADRFVNRELSWLEFDRRVLDQAADPSLPLLERAKFLAITSSNLDEFVMVRVGSLKIQYERNAMVRDPSGMTISQQLQAVSRRCNEIATRQYSVLCESLEPQLAAADIRHINLNDCNDRCSEAAEQRFRNDVFAVVSPQAVFDERPFPLLQGLRVNLCVRLKPAADIADDPADAAEGDQWEYAIVPLGRNVPRLVMMPSDRGRAYVLLEELVASGA